MVDSKTKSGELNSVNLLNFENQSGLYDLQNRSGDEEEISRDVVFLGDGG